MPKYQRGTAISQEMAETIHPLQPNKTYPYEIIDYHLFVDGHMIPQNQKRHWNLNKDELTQYIGITTIVPHSNAMIKRIQQLQHIVFPFWNQSQHSDIPKQELTSTLEGNIFQSDAAIQLIQWAKPSNKINRYDRLDFPIGTPSEYQHPSISIIANDDIRIYLPFTIAYTETKPVVDNYHQIIQQLFGKSIRFLAELNLNEKDTFDKNKVTVLIQKN